MTELGFPGKKDSIDPQLDRKGDRQQCQWLITQVTAVRVAVGRVINELPACPDNVVYMSHAAERIINYTRNHQNKWCLLFTVAITKELVRYDTPYPFNGNWKVDQIRGAICIPDSCKWL